MHPREKAGTIVGTPNAPTQSTLVPIPAMALAIIGMLPPSFCTSSSLSKLKPEPLLPADITTKFFDGAKKTVPASSDLKLTTFTIESTKPSKPAAIFFKPAGRGVLQMLSNLFKLFFHYQEACSSGMRHLYLTILIALGSFCRIDAGISDSYACLANFRAI
jgi:hypothetical protein